MSISKIILVGSLLFSTLGFGAESDLTPKQKAQREVLYLHGLAATAAGAAVIEAVQFDLAAIRTRSRAATRNLVTSSTVVGVLAGAVVGFTASVEASSFRMESLYYSTFTALLVSTSWAFLMGYRYRYAWNSTNHVALSDASRAVWGRDRNAIFESFRDATWEVAMDASRIAASNAAHKHAADSARDAISASGETDLHKIGEIAAKAAWSYVIEHENEIRTAIDKALTVDVIEKMPDVQRVNFRKISEKLLSADCSRMVNNGRQFYTRKVLEILRLSTHH